MKTVLSLVGLVITLLFLNACTSNKRVIPGSGERTAAKKAPDFTQKEILTSDGHTIKYEGSHDNGFVRSYKNGKKDGITAFYRNSVLYGEKSYKEDVLDGWSINYYYPFTLSEIYYVNGKKHGVAKEWCDGRKKLKVREHYHHGQLDGLSEEWRCMGKHYLIRSTEYKNGKKDGIEKIYDDINHRDGSLYSSIRYKNGKKHGVSKIYHSKGKLCCLDTYKNGIREGKSEFWDHTGKRIKETVYKNGREFDTNGNFIPKIKEKLQ